MTDINNSNENHNDTVLSEALNKSKRRMVLKHIWKYDGDKDVRKLVDRIISSYESDESNNEKATELIVEDIRKPPKVGFAVLTLQTEKMAQELIQFVNKKANTDDATFKNKKGFSFEAESSAGDDENLDKKRKFNGDDDGASKRTQREPPKPKYLTDDQVRDIITPYWRLSKDEQILRKQREMIKRCTIKIIQEIKKIFQTRDKEARRNSNVKRIPLYEWATKKRAIELEQIIPSPIQYTYRNKCEFTFGYRYTPKEDGNDDELNKIPSVGYMTSGWIGGVSLPHSTYNTPTECCGIADIINNFLSTSPLPPYDPKLHIGLWRTVTIRFSYRTGTCMVIIQHAPPTGGAGARECGSDDYSEHFESEKKRLIEVLTKAPIPLPTRDIPSNDFNDSLSLKEPLRVTSMYFQEYGGLSNPTADHPVQHVYGDLAMQEKLGKCTFQVSPGAFFQVNTLGAERLYGEVVRRIKEKEPSDPSKVLLLDVCCGTGTIGLTCVKEGVAGHLLGVDISSPAIEDAQLNASKNWTEANGSNNARFVASRAELVLGKEIMKAKAEHDITSIIAVVDPARDGLHPDVVRAIRSTKEIQRLIYVSCNPTKSLVRDAGILCAPATKKYTGAPFYVTAGRPVDMFPMTDHCEMVLVFDRLECDVSTSATGGASGSNES